MTTTIQRKSPTIFPYRGKWRIQYVDLTGRSRTKTAETKQDAYRELVRLEQQMALGYVDRPPREIPTLSTWLDTWIASREGEVRLTTLLGFETTIRRHIRPILGAIRLDKLGTRDVEAMYHVLATRNGLSPATVRKVHALLNQSLSAALRYGVLTRNPMTSVKAPRVTTPAIDTLSGTEVRAILDTASARRDDSYPRFLLALRLGLRQGECLALTWADVDFARSTVSVTKSVDVLPGLGAIVSPPKSAQSRRVVPMDSETFRAFQALKCRSGEPEGASLLFPSAKGVFRNARVDYDAWRRLLAEAGVRYVKLHAARHTAATLFLESGADARSIQLILGHSSPGFTLATYVHPKSETLRAIIERSSQ